MTREIQRLLVTISERSSDRATIDELLGVVNDPSRWIEAHDIFGRIRDKTLRSIELSDVPAGAQYAFEEVCAKSIYNESSTDMPFDADSPFWVLPLAIQAARELGIDEKRVIAAVLEDD